MFLIFCDLDNDIVAIYQHWYSHQTIPLVSNGNADQAAQLIMHRQEIGDTIMSPVSIVTFLL
jgi:hypothetical protein